MSVQTSPSSGMTTNPNPQLRLIQHKKAILHFSLNMDETLKNDWKEHVEPMIDEHLKKVKIDGDLSKQLLLASRHRNENRLKPSIVILCLSRRHKSEIEKSFRSEQWRQMFLEKNLKLRVIIDKNFGETGGRKTSIMLRELDPRSE